MMNAFFSGYVSLLKKLSIILFLLGTGSLLCFAFVWPLWYLATKYTGLYTCLALAFFALLAVFSIAGKIRKELQKCSTTTERMRYLRGISIKWIFRCLMLACIWAAVSSVLAEKRLMALVYGILLVVIYGFSASKA